MKKIVWLFSLFFLMACSEKELVVFSAQKISNGDECHVCGMLINRLPGPKSQAVFDKKLVNFCSTRDMNSFVQEEENTHRVSQIFVQNMHNNDWQNPKGQYIDGRKAWYVEGSSKKGGMGPTFVSFEKQQDAKDFSIKFGGVVKAFLMLGITPHQHDHSHM